MRHLIAVLLLALPVLAAAAPPKSFDARVEAVMKASEVPGAAIAIVENGKVTLARGYGVRKLGSRRRSAPTRCSRSARPPRPSRPRRSQSSSKKARSAGTTG